MRLPDTLIDHLSDAVLLLGPDLRVLGANTAACTLLGAPPGALAGRAAAALFVEDIAPALSSQAESETAEYQVGARLPDGASLPLQALASATDTGGERRYTLILRDGAARQEAAWRARAAGERRHKTFTQASHELRTPLASILGFSELLLKREFDPAGRQELLEIIHQQSGRMLKVVNQVFDLARVEAGGRAALRLAPTPVEAMLVQALGIVAPLGANERVKLDAAPGLPPVAADPARLAQALGLALDNAIRHSSPGSPILLGARAAPGHTVLIEVRDLGAGMAPAVRERLFEPFYRGPQAQDSEGTGLGMAIFKEIMDLHQAVVEVDSAPGSGTVLSIRLPAAGDSGG